MLKRSFLIAALYCAFSASAFAGSNKYVFVKSCSFNSARQGEVKVQVFKDAQKTDLALAIQSSADAGPVLFDDLDVMKKYDEVLQTNLTKVAFYYRSETVVIMKLYLNKDQSQWARAKFYYKGEREAEVVETNNCSIVAR